MKKIITLLLIPLLFTLSSCSDFLDKEPASFFSPDNLFTTEEGLDAGLTGIYDNLNGWPSIFQWNSWQLRESLTEYSVPDPGSVDPSRIGKNDIDNTIWALRSNWSWAYKMIAGSNLVLASLENIDLEDEARIEGEAKFLRAWSYFLLVRFYGDIPLLLKPYDPTEPAPSRDPQEEVYAQIESDLLDAEQLMPDESAQIGRVNKWVAKAILAKVYLTMAGNPLNRGAEYYTKARDKAAEVINSGRYSLLPAYSDNFRVDNNAESIWEVQNRPEGNENHMNFLFLPRGFAAAGEAIAMPTETFISSFPEGDVRRAWGITDEVIVDNEVQTLTRPIYFKYIDEGELNKQSSFTSGQNVPIIRLADLYLIAAEAENETNGPTADAFSWINALRARARMDPSNADHVPDFTGLGQNEFREAVFNERRRELFIEGDGWFDLKRLNRFDLIKARRSEFELINPDIVDWPIPDFETESNPNIG